jgi:hypothetical protein
MRSFEVENSDPERFVALVSAEVEDRDLGDVVNVQLEGDRLTVRFRYLGTSTLTYRVVRRDQGFVAELEDQRVATFHAPFQGRFEDRFDQVLDRVGARPT